MTSYPETLSAAWAAHLAPRAADAPTVVSTFAGCGGSSLGYSMAGYRELLASEWDAHAMDTFRLNFPHTPVVLGDICDLDPSVLALPVGDLDVLDGSPPCQGFSSAGRRQLDDPRNQLFRQFVRLLEAWRPRVFVMENVSGLVKGKMRFLFAEMLTALKAAGYRVTARLLDASYLGVPQARHRLVFVGVRDDLGLNPVHPRPRRPQVTAAQAFGGLEDPGEVKPLSPPRIAQLAALIPPGGDGARILRAAGRRGSMWSLKRVHPDRPSMTLTKMSRVGQLHPHENRYLGTREVARLQSFPDEWTWPTGSTYEEIHARVGNSVPPLLMREVASTIDEKILRPAHGR